MIAVFSTLTVFAISVIVVRVATVALSMTGISRDLAHFQALSAFTGSGFTTRESEDIVNHPIRRRIAMHLMLMGHVGFVVAIPSLLLSFLNTGGRENWSGQVALRSGVLGGGLLVLCLAANSKHVERIIWAINTWAMARLGGLELHDYTRLLRVGQNYVVCELTVEPGEWLAGKTLEEMSLNHEGLLVLGIEKPGGEYLGTPRGKTRLDIGDCLIVYGRQESLLELADRRAGMEGNIQHMLAVTRQMDEAQE
jgi:hypothetical protein